jgi:hypothetical protein
VNAPSIAITESRAPAQLHRARVLVRVLTEARPPEADDEIVELALSEGLGPWLGARVAEARVAVPPRRVEHLVWEHQMCLASNLVRARAARVFAERCHRAGVALAWLKGMAMIEGFIDPGSRSMADLDVLVPASRWHDACRLAGELPCARAIGPASRGYTTAHDYVRAFSLASGVTLEVHRFVCEASLFGIDHEGPDGLFARAIPGTSGVLALQPGDLFLTLAAHAAKHTFELPLRSFLDGIVMMRAGSLDLRRLEARAIEWRMSKAFRLWLQCLAALAPSLPAATDDGIVAPLAGPVWSRTSEAVAWQRFLRLAWIVDGRGDWVRHVATRAAFRLRDVISS